MILMTVTIVAKEVFSEPNHCSQSFSLHADSIHGGES